MVAPRRTTVYHDRKHKDVIDMLSVEGIIYVNPESR